MKIDIVERLLRWRKVREKYRALCSEHRSNLSAAVEILRLRKETDNVSGKAEWISEFMRNKIVRSL